MHNSTVLRVLVAHFLVIAAASAQTPLKLGDTLTTATGLRVVPVALASPGSPQPKAGQLVMVHYIGRLTDGRGFDSSTFREPIAFRLGRGNVIKGWDEGIALLHVGDSVTLVIPAELAYGARAIGDRIPANSPLVFHVRLVGLADRTAGDVLREQIETNGPEKATAAWHALVTSGFGDLYLSEAEINQLGYEYLRQGFLAKAVAVFSANVEAFPNSANVYDSLGEAYAAIGDKEKAIANYQRSLALDPDNGNAKTMLETLGGE